MFESLLETITAGLNLSAEQIEIIKSLWTRRQLRRGEFFQRAGEVTTHGGFVVHGCFRTYAIDRRGGESIIYFSPERAFIGDIASAVTGRPTPYAVDAIELSVILTIPDGGTGHPDHRLVSGIVTQLQRTGAPGAERVFYMSLPVESMRAMNPQRGAPPLLVPQARYFTTRISFGAEDFAAAKRSMACHRTQFTPEVVERVSSAAAAAWNNAIPLVPAFFGATATTFFP